MLMGLGGRIKKKPSEVSHLAFSYPFGQAPTDLQFGILLISADFSA